MTIVVTSIAPSLIVMTVDSAMTDYYTDHREYYTGRKAYPFPGVGCVATWGAISKQFGPYLNSTDIKTGIHSIEDLRDVVWTYLTDIYRPRDDKRDEVGYHVSGFDAEGNPRHYQILWGPKDRESEESSDWDYYNIDSTPPPKTIRLIYDGRFNLAHVLVNTMIKEIRDGHEIRHNLLSRPGLIRFNDFIARFAGELTKEVGPPFYTFVISPSNSIEVITNKSWCPLKGEDIWQRLASQDKEI